MYVSTVFCNWRVELSENELLHYDKWDVCKIPWQKLNVTVLFWYHVVLMWWVQCQLSLQKETIYLLSSRYTFYNIILPPAGCHRNCYPNLVISTVYVLKTRNEPASHKFNSVPSLSTNTIIPLFQSRNLIPTCRHPNPFGYHCPALEDDKTCRDDSVTTRAVRSSHIKARRTRSRDTEVDRWHRIAFAQQSRTFFNLTLNWVI